MSPAVVRSVSVVVAVAAALLLAWVTVRGYDPGDAAGATRMRSTQQTGLISLVLAVVALLPLGVVRVVAAALAVVFLLLALGFFSGVLGGR